MADRILLVGDIGGTNARFALVDETGRGYQDELVLQCRDFESPELAISDYLQTVGAARPNVICLAAAGPVVDGGIDLTNNHWLVREARLLERFNCSSVRLLNDFEAIAYSLTALDAQATQVVGLNQRPDLTAPVVTVGVVGPGTGLGAAALLKRGDQLFPLVTEAGHIGFAPETARQQAVWDILRHRFGRVSDERLVSGTGLVNIYSALAEIHDGPASLRAAADIFEHVNDNPLANEAVSLFFEILGQVAGNFVLATGSFDGLFIAGGIVQRYPDLLANSSFRNSFEAKGRHRHLMERVPTLLVRHPQLGLLGASVLARSLLD